MAVAPVNQAVAPGTPTPGTTSAYQQRIAALESLGRPVDPTDPEGVRATAGLMLAELAFKPMLAEMRKLPFGKGLFDGGRTEEIFGERLDQEIADTVAGADTGGLTAQFARYLQPPGSDQANWATTQDIDKAHLADKTTTALDEKRRS
jgi:hypothetical protein